MEEETISLYKKKLIRSRVGWGKSIISEGRGVCRNEALKECHEIEVFPLTSPEKSDDLHTRAISLNKPFRYGMSPFNPPNGFYIRNVLDIGKGLYLEILGQTKESSTLSFVKFVVKEVYETQVIVDPFNKHKGLIFKGNEEIGKVCLFGSGKNRCIKVLVKRFKQRIIVKFWNKGLIIKNVIICPLSVKEKIFPKLQKFAQDYQNLSLITKSKMFLSKLEGNKNNE